MSNKIAPNERLIPIPDIYDYTALEISINGNRIDNPAYEIQSVSITREINLIPSLRISILDGNVEQIIIGSAPPSHRQGPHYLGILRYTDIPETISLTGRKVKLYGDTPDVLAAKGGARCSTLAACLQ